MNVRVKIESHYWQKLKEIKREAGRYNRIISHKNENFFLYYIWIILEFVLTIFPSFNLAVQYGWMYCNWKHRIPKCVKHDPSRTSVDFSFYVCSYISIFLRDFFLAVRLSPQGFRGRRHIFMLNRDFEIRYCSLALALWREVRMRAYIRRIRIARAGEQSMRRAKCPPLRNVMTGKTPPSKLAICHIRFIVEKEITASPYNLLSISSSHQCKIDLYEISHDKAISFVFINFELTFPLWKRSDLNFWVINEIENEKTVIHKTGKRDSFSKNRFLVAY